jgi:hypothetical protein
MDNLMINNRMKSRFCSAYLSLFLLDGFLGLLRGAGTIIGFEISFNLTFKLLAGVFSFAIFICAIIQSVLAFWKKWKLSARIVGLYVIFYTMIAAIMGFILGIIATLEGIGPLETGNFVLGSVIMNVLAIAIGLIQIGLFIWAAKDLSKGHYIAVS